MLCTLCYLVYNVHGVQLNFRVNFVCNILTLFCNDLSLFSGNYPSIEQITSVLLCGVPENRQRLVAEFVLSLFKTYSDLFFTYLEINPLGKNSRFNTRYHSRGIIHAVQLIQIRGDGQF